MIRFSRLWVYRVDNPQLVKPLRFDVGNTDVGHHGPQDGHPDILEPTQTICSGNACLCSDMWVNLFLIIYPRTRGRVVHRGLIIHLRVFVPEKCLNEM